MNCGEPVFMNSLAGPWLKTSVAIDFTMQTSSTIFEKYGNSSLTSAPLSPYLANFRTERAAWRRA